MVKREARSRVCRNLGDSLTAWTPLRLHRAAPHTPLRAASSAATYEQRIPADARASVSEDDWSVALEMSSTSTSSPADVFDRVVCAIDRSPASLEAARLLRRLMPVFTQLTLCAVVNPSMLVNDGGIFTEEAVTRDVEEALERAQSELVPRKPATLHIRRGPPVEVLLNELRAERATLLALGSHGQSRAAGIVTGSVASKMLHTAPCPVLLARSPERAGQGRDEVLVGFDGSGSARRALAVGRELAERLLLGLHVIIATGERHPPQVDFESEEIEPALTGLRACS